MRDFLRVRVGRRSTAVGGVPIPAGTPVRARRWHGWRHRVTLDRFHIEFTAS